MKIGHVDWLLNRIEELEKDNKRLRDLNYHNNLPAMKSMYEENQRYKQALEEIARGRFPGASYKARQALKGE